MLKIQNTLKKFYLLLRKYLNSYSTSNVDSTDNFEHLYEWTDQAIEVSSFVFDPNSKTVHFSVLAAKAYKKIKNIESSQTSLYRVFYKVNNVDCATLESPPEEVKLFIKEEKLTEKLFEIICFNGKLKMEGENIRYAICVEPASTKNVSF
jgi:hypothetical protein